MHAFRKRLSGAVESEPAGTGFEARILAAVRAESQLQNRHARTPRTFRSIGWRFRVSGRARATIAVVAIVIGSAAYATSRLRQTSALPAPHPTAELKGAAFVSSGDAWAVGFHQETGRPSQTLIQRWSGADWTPYDSPNPGAEQNALYGVSGASSDDVWAVGFTRNSGSTRTLILHWTGSRWSVVPSPNGGGGDNLLLAVSAVSKGNAWAVGSTADTAATVSALVEHWDGERWRLVTSPIPGNRSTLAGVAALPSGEVWVVGSQENGDGQRRPFAARWTGTIWVLDAMPDGLGNGDLVAVTAVNSQDVWASGHYESLGKTVVLLQHWDGQRWVVASPSNPGVRGTELRALSAARSGDIWA